MILLDAGASPHLSNAKGETPLDVAALYGKLEVVSFLIDHDNTVIASTKSLLDAIPPNRLPVAKVLLDFGMDACAQQPDSGRDSALHLAVRFTRVEMAKMLLEFGADPYLKNDAGETPTDLVKKYGAQHKQMKEELLVMFAESEEKEIVTPAVVLDTQSTAAAGKAVRDSYPTLKVLTRWAEDISAHRSASTPEHPVTNVLSSDPTTFWLAPGIGRQWVVFDFGSIFTITSITLGLSPGKEMPKEFQLEVAPNMKASISPNRAKAFVLNFVRVTR